MPKFLAAFLFCLAAPWILFAVGGPEQIRGEYVIRGDLSHLEDEMDGFLDAVPEKIYLYQDYEYIDSADLTDWKFEITGTVDTEYVQDAYLSIPGLEALFFFPVFIEPGEITLNLFRLPEEGMHIVLAEGTPANELISSYYREFTQIPHQVIEIYRDTTLSYELADSLAYALMMKQDSMVRNFYRDHRESPVAPYLAIGNFYGSNRWNELREELRYLGERFPRHPALHDVETVLLTMPGLLPGMAAPDFRLRNPAGEEVALGQFEGSYVLLDFWSSVNGTCLDDFKKLKRFPKKIQGIPVVRIGVATDLHRDVWTSSLAKYRPGGIQLWDAGHQVTRSYHITTYPCRFLIDPQGVVAAKGYFTDFEGITWPEQIGDPEEQDEVGFFSWRRGIIRFDFRVGRNLLAD